MKCPRDQPPSPGRRLIRTEPRGSEHDELADRAAAREQQIQPRACGDTQTGIHNPDRGVTAEIRQAQYFDKVIDVPGVCQRLEPVITTAQKTTEVLQFQ